LLTIHYNDDSWKLFAYIKYYVHYPMVTISFIRSISKKTEFISIDVNTMRALSLTTYTDYYIDYMLDNINWNNDKAVAVDLDKLILINSHTFRYKANTYREQLIIINTPIKTIVIDITTVNRLRSMWQLWKLYKATNDHRLFSPINSLYYNDLCHDII
jgi:hypothetical protein